MIKRALVVAILLLSTVGTYAQQPTLQDRLNAIRAELDAIEQAAQPQLPLPGHVKTVQELVLAFARCDGQTITIDPGVYFANLVWSCPDSTPHTLVVGVAAPAMQTLQTGTPAVDAGATSAVSLYPADGKAPTITVLGSNVTFQGLTIGAGVLDSSTVVLGSPVAVDPFSQPNNVVFDAVEVLAGPNGGFRGFELHSRSVTITRSRVIGYRHTQRDAQAVYVCNGPGPHTIDSNWLEGSGENVLFGGCTTMAQSQHPANATIANNYVYKPQAWRQGQPQAALVKNNIECKSCDGALIKGNVIDGNWVNGQTGIPVLFTPRNQYKVSPWTVVRNVVFEDNVIRNTPQGYGVHILYTDDVAQTQPTADITIRHNLFMDSPNGVLFVGGVAGKAVIVNNTWPKIRYNLMQFAQTVLDPVTRVKGFNKTDLTFTGNVAKGGEYGISGQNMSPGVPSLTGYTLPSSVFAGNVIEKYSSGTVQWPAGNTLLPAGGLAPLLDALFHYTPDTSLGW